MNHFLIQASSLKIDTNPMLKFKLKIDVEICYNSKFAKTYASKMIPSGTRRVMQVIRVQIFISEECIHSINRYTIPCVMNWNKIKLAKENLVCAHANKLNCTGY